MVPVPDDGHKPSKAALLQNAIEHVESLEKETGQLQDEASQLKGEISALKLSLRFVLCGVPFAVGCARQVDRPRAAFVGLDDMGCRLSIPRQRPRILVTSFPS